MVYDLETNEGQGLLDYLKKGEYKTACTASHETRYPPNLKKYWTPEDEAIWAFAHIRHDYPGCLAGVASGESGSTVVLWELKPEDTLIRRYWNPLTKTEEDAEKYKPRIIFV